MFRRIHQIANSNMNFKNNEVSYKIWQVLCQQNTNTYQVGEHFSVLLTHLTLMSTGILDTPGMKI